MNMSMFKIRRKDGVFNTQPPFPPLLPFSPSPFLFLSEKQSTSTSSSPTSSSSGNRISPAILFVIVIVAVMVFISGLIHLLVRFLMKQRSSSGSESNRHNQMSDSDAFQRQLQQLFHLHDSGLDQAFIDALPVFVYEEIVGLKEPFDCAVCLCEFSGMDKLRLLPLCSHAFHIDCIDTWLLSNSTCPLCRGSLYNPGIMIENPVFNFEDPREEGFLCRGENGSSSAPKPAENSILNQRGVFSVRLGKFRSSTIVESARGETSSSGGISSGNISNLDARRCYSMGSYQYVVSELELQVALCPNGDDGGSKKTVKGMDGQNGNSLSSIDGATEGKRISISKGESFSVSKIWLWSKKTKYPSSSETQRGNLPISMSFPTKERDQVT